MEIFRNGKRMTVPVIVGTRPSDEDLAKRNFNPDEERQDMAQGDEPTGETGTIFKYLGMQVEPLTPTAARSIGIDTNTKGVVILGVLPNSDAAMRGLRRGDVITQAQYEPVLSESDLAQRIEAQRKLKRPLLLQIRRRGVESAFVTVKLSEATP
jgi:serine protease Do